MAYQSSLTDRSKERIASQQRQLSKLSSIRYIDEEPAEQSEFLGIQQKIEEKFSLLRMDKRPFNQNALQPYIQHFTKKIKNKKQNSSNAHLRNLRDSQVWSSCIDTTTDNANFQTLPEKKEKLRFNQGIISLQIQKQKLARKCQQYQTEDENYMTTNDNYQTKLNGRAQSVEKSQFDETPSNIQKNQQKQVTDFSNGNQIIQTRDIQRKLKTIESKSTTHKDRIDRKASEIMQRQTLNIIRQKTYYGSIRKSYERSNSAIDQVNLKRPILTSGTQAMTSNKELDIKLDQIRLTQPGHLRNSKDRDVSKSIQMQTLSSIVKDDQMNQQVSSNALSKLDDQSQHESLQKQIGDISIAQTLKTKYLVFKPFTKNMNEPDLTLTDCGYYFKFFNPQTDIKLVRYTLEDNGFIELTGQYINNKSFSNQLTTNGGQIKVQRKEQLTWTVMWSCQVMKSNVFQSMSKHQKINHFPRSFELTRKDFMNDRIARMVAIHGKRNFNFTPITYVLPKEFDQVQKEMEQNRNQWWIIKPSASAQGKGIYITNNINEVQSKQSLVASHYINNPLLINGLKFDLRIYVAITSINPLRIYIYDEGLTRFATCQYQTVHSETKKNRFMHLTNYSINKMNKNAFVQNNDPSTQEAYGSKWSLSALRNQMKKMGIDSWSIFKRIEDIVIKTIISAEPILNNAFEMFVPYRSNCFELLGFDILVDDQLNPWLLEVNMSPSLSCDSALDQEIKSQLIADLLNLAGIVKLEHRMDSEKQASNKSGYSHGQAEYFLQNQLNKQNKKHKKSLKPEFDVSFSGYNTVTNQRNNFERNKIRGKEKTIVKQAEEEYERRGNFRLIFPNANYGYYKQFFEEDRPLNSLLERSFREVKIIGYQRNQSFN